MTLDAERRTPRALPTPGPSPTTAEWEAKLTDINAHILSATAAHVAASRRLDAMSSQDGDGHPDDDAAVMLRDRLRTLEEQIEDLKAASVVARAAYNKSARQPPSFG